LRPVNVSPILKPCVLTVFNSHHNLFMPAGLSANCRTRRLPSLAQDALEFGHDGKNVRRIAGLMRPNQADLLPLMPGLPCRNGSLGTTRTRAGRLATCSPDRQKHLRTASHA